MSLNFFAGISDWQVGQSPARPAFGVVARVLGVLKSRRRTSGVADGFKICRSRSWLKPVDHRPSARSTKAQSASRYTASRVSKFLLHSRIRAPLDPDLRAEFIGFAWLLA